jgi:HEAT repeat protein
VRAAAVAALGALGHRAAAPVIVALIEDRDHDSEVRASAALAVGQLVGAAETDLVRTLVRAHDREGNATVARFLLLSLGRIGGPHAEIEIERVMLRESAEERVFAELALGMVARSSGSVQKLAPLLEALRTVRIQDERCALLCALGLSGMQQAYEAIANETLRAGAPEVRRAGIVALEILGRPECLPLFQKLLLDDATPEVRVQAARALARLDPGSASTLIHALSSSRSRGTSERAALILCLGFTRDPSTIDPLLSLLREAGHASQEREAATAALGLVYDPHRAPPMARVGEAKSFLRESAEISALLALSE